MAKKTNLEVVSCHVQDKGVFIALRDPADENRRHVLPVVPDKPLERPLESFWKALLALSPVARRFVDIPQKYWTDKTFSVRRVFLGYNKFDARSVKFDCVGVLQGGREWKIRTPTLRMDPAVDGEKNVLVEVEEADVQTIEKFCAEVLKYYGGERSKTGELFQEADPEEDQPQLAVVDL